MKVKVMIIKPSVPRCNVCGAPLDFDDLQNDFRIDRRVHYGSENDGRRVCLRMCCNCFDETIALCALSPIVGTM